MSLVVCVLPVRFLLQLKVIGTTKQAWIHCFCMLLTVLSVFCFFFPTMNGVMNQYCSFSNVTTIAAVITIKKLSTFVITH